MLNATCSPRSPDRNRRRICFHPRWRSRSADEKLDNSRDDHARPGF